MGSFTGPRLVGSLSLNIMANKHAGRSLGEGFPNKLLNSSGGEVFPNSINRRMRNRLDFQFDFIFQWEYKMGK